MDVVEKVKLLFVTLLRMENEVHSPFYCSDHNAENIIQWLTDITAQGCFETEFGFAIPLDFDFSILEGVEYACQI